MEAMRGRIEPRVMSFPFDDDEGCVWWPPSAVMVVVVWVPCAWRGCRERAKSEERPPLGFRAGLFARMDRVKRFKPCAASFRVDWRGEERNVRRGGCGGCVVAGGWAGGLDVAGCVGR